MSIFVYRRQPSSSARELAEALGGRRTRGRVPLHITANRGDTVVCWGEQQGPISGVKVINGRAIQSKFQAAQTLRAAGVPTIEVTQRLQGAQAATDPAVAIFDEMSEAAADFAENASPNRNRVFQDGLTQLITGLQRLQVAIRTPAPQAQEWVGRTNDHVGGQDLLRPPAHPDFYVKKLNLRGEFRIHSFRGKSLRAGIKAPREGATPHAWIRTWDGGWRILYDGVSSKKKHRELAHAAVSALGLDFGAVDIGETPNGSLVVLEVNRAPGLEGGTINVYANAIRGVA